MMECGCGSGIPRVVRGNDFTARVLVVRNVPSADSDGGKVTRQESIDLAKCNGIVARRVTRLGRRTATGFAIDGSYVCVPFEEDVPCGSYGLEVAGRFANGQDWRFYLKPGEFVDIVEATSEGDAGGATSEDIYDFTAVIIGESLSAAQLAELQSAAENANAAADEAESAAEEASKAAANATGIIAALGEAEAAREEAEAGRKDAEASRAEAEGKRAEAEEARAAAFDASEETRQETFEASEKSRQAAFDTAEAERRANEELRKAAETGREEAERERQDEFEANEAAWQEAEAKRAKAEEERQAAEAGRQAAEKLREDNASDVRERVGTLEGKAADLGDRVDTLDGDESVEGSVRKRVKDAVSSLVGSAPDTLDTLQKIAEEMRDPGKGAAVTVLDQVAGKADKGTTLAEYGIGDAYTKAEADALLADKVGSTDPRLSDARPASDVQAWAKAAGKPAYTKEEVGLGNVDDTSDADKPISAATQAALDGKADKAATLAGYGITDGATSEALADEASGRESADTALQGNIDSLAATVGNNKTEAGTAIATLNAGLAAETGRAKEAERKLVAIAYSDLVSLRDGGKLVAGREYRITDYQATTTQENTSSAGHQFDIIVRADSASTLNEEARACPHEGDTYFAGSRLEAWRLMYSLDNDTSRFAWAMDGAAQDGAAGKGVVYRMVDEWGNDCPYDFKNIMFKRCKILGVKEDYTIKATGTDNNMKEADWEYYAANKNAYPARGVPRDGCGIGDIFTVSGRAKDTDSGGNATGKWHRMYLRCFNDTGIMQGMCIYHVTADTEEGLSAIADPDCFADNEWTGRYMGARDTGSIAVDTTDSRMFYTFSKGGEEDTDLSVDGSGNKVCGNVAGPCADEDSLAEGKYVRKLNDNVFLGCNVQGNGIGADSTGNTFSSLMKDCTIGAGCMGNTVKGSGYCYHSGGGAVNGLSGMEFKAADDVMDRLVRANVIPIPFEDSKVKDRCVTLYDKDGDGEVYYKDVKDAAGTPQFASGGTNAFPHTYIRHFRELRYWDSATEISYNAFCNNIFMEDVVLPGGVTTIQAQAFLNCSGITLSELPGGVTSIGASAFSGCSGITLSELPGGVTSIGASAFSGCSGITLSELPGGVTSIGAGAFSGCSGITLSELPGGVTSIGASAFSGCSGITTLAIGEQVTSIGSRAFWATGLTTLVMEGSTPPTLGDKNAFGNSTAHDGNYDLTIYVPDDAVDTYKAATNWSIYTIKGTSEKATG